MRGPAASTKPSKISRRRRSQKRAREHLAGALPSVAGHRFRLRREPRCAISVAVLLMPMSPTVLPWWAWLLCALVLLLPDRNGHVVGKWDIARPPMCRACWLRCAKARRLLTTSLNDCTNGVDPDEEAVAATVSTATRVKHDDLPPRLRG